MQYSLVPALLLLSISATAQTPADVELQPVPGISDLTVTAPLGLKHAGDGSGRLFIVEQGGRVRVIDSAGNLLVEPFIDISSSVACCGERGLLDIAFHPEYSSAGADGEGLFYLHFSSDGSAIAGTDIGDTVVAEFSVSGDPNVANPEPERIILTVTQDFSNHNGGQMRFGPDGYLYLGLGDGGSGGDPCERAQTLDPAQIETGGNCRNDPSVALLGSILRIDVDTTTPNGANNLCAASGDGAANYAIPADNPFARSPTNPDETRCAEIWQYGIRNPWRFSFDRDTGDLWIGDVGQNEWEEIDLLEAPIPGGRNLGWDCYEASSSFEPAGCPADNELTFPVLEYNHTSTGGCSVTGGYRYRGPVINLQGQYIYGDFCSGDIWFANNDGSNWQNTLTSFNEGNIRSFGEDEQGNLYVIAGGGLFRFEGDTETIFADGFEQ